MTTTAYYRVSTTKQDQENQAKGVREYATAKGIQIDREIEDTASGSTSWKERPIAGAIDRAGKGDLILVSEISRLARSTLQVLEIAAAAVAAGVTIIATKNALVIDASTSSKITVTILGLAAEIERDLIRARTTEALAARKAKGLPMGRPHGSTSESKLAGRRNEIGRYINAKLPHTAIARLLGVSRGTLARYLERCAAEAKTGADTLTFELFTTEETAK